MHLHLNLRNFRIPSASLDRRINLRAPCSETLSERATRPRLRQRSNELADSAVALNRSPPPPRLNPTGPTSTRPVLHCALHHCCNASLCFATLHHFTLQHCCFVAMMHRADLAVRVILSLYAATLIHRRTSPLYHFASFYFATLLLASCFFVTCVFVACCFVG